MSNAVKERISKALEGKGYIVTFQNVPKPNGMSYDGLSVGKKDNPVHVTADWANLLRRLNGNEEEVVRWFVERVEAPEVDTANDIAAIFQQGYDAVKPHLALKTMNKEANQEYLANIPYIVWNDLAAIAVSVFGEASITVCKDHIDMWGITEEQLFEDALKMAPVNAPLRITSMYETLVETMGEETVQAQGITPENVPMKVASNEAKCNGAATVFYPDFLDRAKDAVGDNDFYILPSSIHELLLLPDVGIDMDIDQLQALVWTVNRTQVEPGEMLSDSVYRYNAESGEVEVVA